MNVTYSLTITCRCPVDTSVLDTYEVEVEVKRCLPVEQILEAVQELTATPAFQEDITQALSTRLGARVTSRGTHSGVRTVCECGP